MGTAAEIDKLAVSIKRNLVLAFRVLLDEVDFHPVVLILILLDGLFARHVFADKLLVPLNHLLHALLDALKIVGRERRRAIEVIEESRLGRRPMSKFRLRE